MLLLFGPHVPDIEAPEFEITFPPDDSQFVAPTTFALKGEVNDNLHPQFYTVQIFLDGELFDEKLDIGLDQVIQTPPPSEYDIRVVVIDAEGNAAEDSVFFTILEEGSEQPPPNDDDEDDAAQDDDTQGCQVGSPRDREGQPWGWLLLGLIVPALFRRREC